jgi:preprotein translocase subunit SecD
MVSAEAKEAKRMKLYKDFRIIIFIVAMLFALVAIHPGYSPQSGLSSDLQYGLDLEGGTRLQLELQGVIAGINIDPAAIIEKEYSDALGAIEITDSSDYEVIFKTTEPLEEEDIDAIGYGSVYVRDNEVTLGINRDYVVEKYLSKYLDTEVIHLGSGMYEIRSTISENELSDVLAGVGGSIAKDIQGNLEFKKTVTKDTQEMTEAVLNEKLNLWGLKEVPITPVEDSILMVDLAGIDLSTAMDIVATPGKFEIRIQIANNTTSHVVWGEHITAVDMPKMQGGSWGVGFTVDAIGATAIRDAAVESGAVDDPAAHELIMLLDDEEIYSAPLADDLASNLRDLYERGENVHSHPLIASTGADEEGRERAEQLHVHLRAGALPVEVAVIGSWQVPASLGAKFKDQTMIAGLFALATVAFVIFGRYGRKKILLPMIATSVSEVFMILGFASLVNWQLDLPAIAGIIAVIGTGIDHLVIITDEVLYEGKMPSLKVYLARIGKAFAIIFAAAATTIIAMSPLLVMSFGALKGFAITTIVGVLIGVLIARPAYGRVIRDLLE